MQGGREGGSEQRAASSEQREGVGWGLRGYLVGALLRNGRVVVHLARQVDARLVGLDGEQVDGLQQVRCAGEVELGHAV